MILLTVAGVLCHVAYGCAARGQGGACVAARRRVSLRASGCADRNRDGACAALRRAAPRRLDTAQPVNNCLGIVLYCIVVATCVMTFLQGARRAGCALAVDTFAPRVRRRQAPRRAVIRLLSRRAAAAPLRRASVGVVRARRGRGGTRARARTHAHAQFPARLLACRRCTRCLFAPPFLRVS
jgi:hypothetical protein